jgi:predicted regulator of Ras-like GTPase activity (Roadblock/LC7/MglB family)
MEEQGFMTSKRVFVVHRPDDAAARYAAWLEEAGYEVARADGLVDAARAGGEADLALVALETFPRSALVELDRLSARLGQPGLVVVAADETLPVAWVDEALRLGVARIIPPPAHPADLLMTFEDVEDARSVEGVQGDLRDLGLSSLISIICNEGRKATLRVSHNGAESTVYFSQGEIVHAVLGDQVGEEAIFETLAWGEGQFTLTMGHAVRERTIHTGWAGLVLEGLRRMDETSFDQEQLPPVEAPQPVEWPDAELETTLVEPVRHGPTFELEEEAQTQVAERIEQLYKMLEPRCILLSDRSGRLLDMRGDIQRSAALSLAALVAGSFSATGEVAELLARDRESRRFQQSLQEGLNFSLYSARAGQDWILAVAFEPERTNLGLARQFTLRAAEDLSALAAQERAMPEPQELDTAMDDMFRQQVGDALEDLFA